MSALDRPSNDRRRRLDPDARRAEIVAAATRVFASRPYDTVSLADIASEAGASRALISHYFGDKAGLFATVAMAFAASAADAVRIDLDLPPAERLAHNIDAMLAFAQDNREMVLALMPAGAAGYDSRMRAMADAVRDRVAGRVLTNHFGTTDLPPRFRVAIRAYTGLFVVAVGDWLTKPTLERAEVSDFLATTLLDVIARLRAAQP